MKKNIIFFSVVCLLIVSLLINGNIASTYAATVDKTPPVLKSFKIDNNSVKPGEYLYLNVKAEDDVSGIERASIGFYSYIRGYVAFQFDVDYDPKEGFRVFIPEDTIGGEYPIAFFMLIDKKGNLITYNNKNLYPNDENPFDFKNTTVKVISDTSLSDDVKPPLVSNVTFDKKKINLGEDVRVCAKVKDDSKLYAVIVELMHIDSLSETSYEDMEYDSTTDSYCAYITPSRTGKHTVSNIWAYDIYDNGKGYFSRVHDGLIEIEDVTERIDMPEVEVIGLKSDNEAPVVNSIKLNKQNVVAPGSLKIFVDATDNSGENVKCFAGFISKEKYDKYVTEGIHASEEMLIELIYDELIGKYVGTIDFDQYVSPDKYFLQYVSVRDSSDNSAEYKTSRGEETLADYSDLTKYRKTDDLTFEIKEEFAYDVVTSTINPNVTSIIKEQKDDAVIMIDATNDSIISEEIFEAIKDINKTIYIEYNGYQWVFNGKDITDIKSIDVRVYSELLVDYNVNNKYQEYIAIVFEDNGILPGKAKIRVKTDYTFRYIEGYEDLKLYYFNPSESKYKEMDNRIVLTDDGFYEFEITHNSKYVMSNKGFEEELLTVNDDIVEKEEKDESNENKKNNSNNIDILITVIIVIVVVIIAIAVMLFIKKKMSKKNEDNKSINTK